MKICNFFHFKNCKVIFVQEIGRTLCDYFFLSLRPHKSLNNISFLIKPFSYMTEKTQDNNLNIFKPNRAFDMTWKALFIIFKGISVVRNYLKPGTRPLRNHGQNNFLKWFKIAAYYRFFFHKKMRLRGDCTNKYLNIQHKGFKHKEDIRSF